MDKVTTPDPLPQIEAALDEYVDADNALDEARGCRSSAVVAEFLDARNIKKRALFALIRSALSPQTGRDGPTIHEVAQVIGNAISARHSNPMNVPVRTPHEVREILKRAFPNWLAAAPQPGPGEPVAETLAPLESGNVWQCQIGYAGSLPKGADWPMRLAISNGFRGITGREPKFIFSGWGHKLSEEYLAVVEDREPTPTPTPTPDEAGVRAAVIAECARCVPTNWLDPLLSGSDRVIGEKCDARQIEALLRGIQDRIRALLARRDQS